jgi:radical SAM enzyme (TIGR01210 family)
MAASYPTQKSQRNRWMTERRDAANPVDPFTPYAFLSEEEPEADGNLVSVSTLFLTNRECPWKCVMCDLWRNTLPDTVPPGAILAQINHALERLPHASHIKLYNSGSFFDPRAIPRGDYAGIADRLRGFERVIVECHPALVTGSCLEFQKMLHGRLEVAMGLETAHPGALERLNKGMTPAQFATAAKFLRDHQIDLRVFLLVHPPFIESAETEEWIHRSIDYSFEHAASVVSLIPTRTGNGAMESLASLGEFTAPVLADLERAAEYGISLRCGRVFADLWDLERFSNCQHCFNERRSRLDSMNRRQLILPTVRCDSCGAAR